MYLTIAVLRPTIFFFFFFYFFFFKNIMLRIRICFMKRIQIQEAEMNRIRIQNTVFDNFKNICRYLKNILYNILLSPLYNFLFLYFLFLRTYLIVEIQLNCFVPFLMSVIV